MDALATVSRVSNEWRSNNTRQEKDRSRETESWRFVSGVGFGQYPASALELLTQEGRPPTQFNFIQGKVLTLAGSFLQNPMEVKYEADVGSPEWGAELMNRLLNYNKDSTEWSYAKSQFLLAMLTHRGVLELYKDYKRSPLGDLCVRYVNPFNISFDSRWTTSNIDECKRVWYARFMDAEEITHTFHKKSEEITESLRRLKEKVDDPAASQDDIDKLADRSMEFYDAIGSQYLVLQAMELKQKSVDKLFDVRSQEFLPIMSKETMKALLSLGENSKFLRVLPDEHTELSVTTVCPGLSRELLLEDGPHPLQIGGYPYVVASALKLNGEEQGVVEIMKDPQMTINKREATITHLQMTRANGVELVEEGAFSSPEEFERYKRYKNKPGETFLVAEDANKQERIKLKNGENVKQDMVDSVNRSIGHMDRMYAPPASQALEGKSGESAKLFEDKKEQALVALEFINKTLQSVDHQIGEKFFRGARIVYSGTARVMKIDGEELRLNWPMEGDGGLTNDISLIPRLSIRITQSQSGVSIKRERLNLYSQYGQVVTTPVMKAVLELMMIDVVPNMPETDKDEAKAVQMEFIQLLRKRTAAESAQLDAAIAQSRAPSQPGMPGAPTGPSPAGETPQEGGGFSPEGKSIPTEAALPVDVRSQNQLQ